MLIFKHTLSYVLMFIQQSLLEKFSTVYKTYIYFSIVRFSACKTYVFSAFKCTNTYFKYLNIENWRINI